VPIQTGLENHPASCKIGTVSFLGVKQTERGAGQPQTFSVELAKVMELYLLLLLPLPSLPEQACDR